jgi:acetyl esterase
VSRSEDRTIEGPGGPLRVRITTPLSESGNAPRPILVYYHGGGWVIGSLSSHEGLCRALANASNAIVVSVDYRLAPEHPFPAAAEDAYAAFLWAASHAAEIGGDPARIAVGGDSAGGNLATVASLMLRDRGGPAPVFQLLLYPAFDADFETGSYRAFAEGFLLTRAEMRWFWDQYVPEPSDRINPYAAPARAADLAGLPPAYILTAEYDVLRDEAEAFANRLRQAGVAVTARRSEGMIHGFLRRYMFFEQGREALDEVGRILREALRA